MDDPLPTHTSFLTDEEVEERRNDPTHEVLDLEDKPMEDWQRIDASDAGAMASAVRSRYLALRASHPDLGDDALRDLVVREGGDGPRNPIRSFAETSHTTIFRCLTDRGTDEDRVADIEFMVAVRTRVDRGEITEDEGNALFQETMLKKLSRPGP